MKQYVFATLFGMMLLLSGCISMQYEQKVNKDGTSMLTQSVDMSGFISAMEDMQASMNATASSEDDDFTEQMQEACAKYKNDPEVTCTFSAETNTLSVSTMVTPEEAGYTFTKEANFPNIIYTLKTDQIPQADVDLDLGSDLESQSSQLEPDDPRFTSSDAKQSAASMKLMQVEIDYIIEMPGEIIEAKNGKIEDGKAVYDVLDLMEEGQTVEVVSQESDPIGSLCGPGLILASGLAFVLFARFRG